MKPIATVHWTQDGRECSQSFYRMDWLEAHIRSLISSETSFYTCFTSTTIPVPSVAFMADCIDRFDRVVM